MAEGFFSLPAFFTSGFFAGAAVSLGTAFFLAAELDLTAAVAFTFVVFVLAAAALVFTTAVGLVGAARLIGVGFLFDDIGFLVGAALGRAAFLEVPLGTLAAGLLFCRRT